MIARHIFKHAWQDNRGVAFVEYGLVAPLVVSFIVGILEVAMVFVVATALENSVLASSRYGITGQSGTGGSTREETILTVVEENTFGLVDMQKVTLSSTIYDSFSDIGQAEPFADANGNGVFDTGEAYTDVNGNAQWDADVGIAGLGGPGDIVLYQIQYQIESLTGLFSPFFDRIDHVATVAVRNEPY